MEVLKKIANVKPNKPYQGFTKLSKGFHQVENFRMVKNKFCKKDGSKKSILTELEGEILFLPQCFSQILDEDDLNELNECISNQQCIYLYFGGKHEATG